MVKLAYFKYSFVVYSQILTKAKSTKNIVSNSAIAKNTESIFLIGTSTKNTFILGNFINIKPFSISWLLLIVVLLIKYDFIDIFLNLVK